MGLFSPTFVYNLQSELRVLQETPYAEFQNSGNMWWPAVAKYHSTGAGKLILPWLLSTASLELTGQSSDVTFSDLTILESEYIPGYISKGLELRRALFEDTDANGVALLSQWVTDISQYGVYLPQKVVANFLTTGHLTTSLGYDGVPFFSANHPYNPKNTSAGTYANLLTGGASGAFPGACPIDTSVAFDAPYVNLQKVFAWMNQIKQANGIDPRFLRPRAIITPSQLFPRANALLKSKFGSFASSGSGGGSVEIQGQIQELGFERVYLAPELDADPTSYYVVADQAMTSQLGGMLWVEREPLGIQTYFPMDGRNFELAKKDIVAAIARGRATSGYGHPFDIMKVKAA